MRQPVRWVWMMLGIALLAGCAINTTRLVLPTGFAAQDEGFPVKGMAMRHGRTPVSFGPYATTAMQGWTFPIGQQYGGPPVAVSREQLRYGFTMTDAGEQTGQVSCAVERWFLELLGTIDGAQVGAGFPMDPDAPALSCSMDSLPLVFWMDGHDIVGHYTVPGGRIDIDSLRQVDRGLTLRFGMPVGLRFHRDGRDVMVVDRLAPGRVWFARDLDAATRRQLSMAAAVALLLPH